jgi:hypothetical protein
VVFLEGAKMEIERTGIDLLAPKAEPPTRRPIVAGDLTTMPIVNGRAGHEWHNFDSDQLGNWRLKAFAQATAERGSGLAGEVVSVKYWYVQQVGILDDDSEDVREAYRVVLMRPDLTCVAFVSAGVLESLRSMVAELGPGPYDPPIDVTIHESQTRRGRRVYSIIPA